MNPRAWLIGAAAVFLTGHTLAASIPVPRTGKYAGYSRVVLDVPDGAKWTVEPLGAALRLIFPGHTATKASAKVRQPELGGWAMDAGKYAAVLDIVTPQGVGKRSGFRINTLSASSGKTGKRLVIDLSGAFGDTSPLPAVAPLTFTKAAGRAFKVIVDAGHGGTDMGAIGFVTERPLNLDVAQRVALRLREAGVNVILTRENDGTISNDKPTDLAARASMSTGADAFVSIHANSTVTRRVNSAYGLEVYYFNPSRQRPVFVTPGPEPVAATAIADAITITPAPPAEITSPDSAMTNAAAGLTPSDADATMLGEDPNANPSALGQTVAPEPVMNVAAEEPSVQAPISLAANFEPHTAERAAQSQALAFSVLSSALGATAASNGGVRTDTFVVVKRSVCPAILVEMGYVKHPIEGMQLRNTNYLDRIAYGVARGVVEYLENLPDPR